MVEQNELDVLAMKKASLQQPKRVADLIIRNAIGEHYNLDFTSLKEARDIQALDVIKDRADAKKIAVDGKLFTKAQAREHSLIEDLAL